ncbi:Hypothetical protein, putative [Bodo saltans]|uniref:Bardet-Biedl syndrome 7 protein n=1 Tax=Bodo saltans TaxID=75058 RepID=A0A0S4IYJ2_BODSA|nr:Hypothetical protein, putative [Bodo saltans]|eukprot:CUG55727.1 Hypothetical protein, putative [Bodo saltans]
MLGTTQSLMDFRRHELLTRSSTSRGCLAVFPQGKKSRQRVAVGDSSGSVTVFTIGKHHEIQTQFETPVGPKAVSRVTLYDDQLFFVAGPQICAFSKKGKLFFGFESNMTESARSFQIDTPFIFAGGEYVLTTFKEVNEVGYFMSPDRINEMLYHRHRDANNDEPMTSNYHMYLGCNDRVLRTVLGNQIIAEAGCEAPISAMSFAEDARGKDLVYGTSNGSLGAFRITKGDELARKYSLIPDSRLGSVTSIACTDINRDGTADVILGREDGAVEVHALSLHADNAAPLRMWTANVGEYVTTVATGMITQTDRDEVLVNTFSGKVISFTLSDADVDISNVLPKLMVARAPDLPTAQEVIKTVKAELKNAAALQQPTVADAPVVKIAERPLPVADSPAVVDKPVSGGTLTVLAPHRPQPITQEFLPKSKQSSPTAHDSGPSQLEILHSQVTDMRSQIEKLQAAVDLKRQEFATISGVAEASKVRAVTSEFSIRESFSLDNAAVMTLTIEADVPLKFVGVQCDVSLELLDSESVVTPCQGAIGRDAVETKMLCTLQPAEGRNNRVHVKVRSQEGHGGSIKAYVVCEAQPRSAQTRVFQIRPLCLHIRVVESEVDWASLPLSTLTIQGNFTMRDMHGWLLNTLPEIPEVLTSSSLTNSLFFRNTFQQTALSVRYVKGEAEFNSDSLTTLSILKDCITREATARKIQIRLQHNMRKESILRHLQLLHPLIGYQSSLVAKQKFIEALKEIESQDEEAASTLAPEYRQILADAQKIESEIKLQPQRHQFLKEIALTLFKDKSILFGENATQARTTELDNLLNQYDPQAVENFFGVGSDFIASQSTEPQLAPQPHEGLIATAPPETPNEETLSTRRLST